MKAAWTTTGRGLGLQSLLVRNHKRPHVIVRRCSAQAGADLVEWVRGNGGQVQGVAVQQWGGEGEVAGFGLKAAQDCRAGSCLIALPQRCHLTYDAATDDQRLLALIEQVPAELWGARLALQVLAHRVQGEASPFSTYIANLPKGVPGLPMFFNGETLAALQYPPVTEQVKKRCRWLLSFSQQVLAPVRGTPQDPFGGAEVDANALGWALGVVTSRAFRTRGPSQPASMLPLIDMANHSFSPNCKIAAGGSGDLHMVATRDLSAGEQVLISYGNLSNDFLLMDYGFVVPNNPYDTVQLRFDPGLIEGAKSVAGVKSALQEDAPLPAWQQQPLRMLGLLGEGANTEVSFRRGQSAASVPSSSDSSSAGSSTAAGPENAQQQQQASSAPCDNRLLAATRVMCSTSAEEVSAASASKQLGVWDKPLRTASEVAALRTLTGLCVIALSQFSTSVQDDEAALAANAAGAAGAAAGSEQQQEGQQAQQLSPDMQLALRFRMEKKRLLSEAVDVLAARIKELMAQPAAAPPPGSKPGKGGKVPAAKHGGKGFGG